MPAAGSAAVALALGEPTMALGSALQLAVNLCGMVISGTLTLLLQRHLRRRAVA